MTAKPRDLVYTPSETASIGIKYQQERRQNKAAAIPLGLPSIDEDFLPLLPGELTTIIARPGNGKTSFMMRWARSRAAWLLKNSAENRVVVYATWEQAIEDLHAFDLAANTQISITDMARGNTTDEQFSEMIAASWKNMDRPLWYIGHSLERRRKRPQITILDLAEALTEIDNWSDEPKVIDMVFCDYLQRIPHIGKPESKTIGMDETLNSIKDACLTFGCPFVVGVQAKREVDSRDTPVPMMDDGQWTSAIEQVSDKSISLVRPRKYRQEGEPFGRRNPVIVQGENQMLVNILKQKLGPANIPYWVSFNPIYNRLDELEMKHYDLSSDL